ncbi:MAG: universal stress protein [Anaerolineales bacterium]
MDQLLPAPFPLLGTLGGVAVLMSASAASAQGLQNLSLGLTERRYVPPSFGHRNQFDVADKPVWFEVGIVSVCFLLFGTSEETYLAIYAAGVFVLLSLAGWAVTKRLIREAREKFSVGKAAMIVGTTLAALLTTSATVIIFTERFLEGAWTYFLLIPIFYGTFTYFRNRLGEPTAQMDYLGQLDAAQLAGFGFGQAAPAAIAAAPTTPIPIEVTWQAEPKEKSKWREQRVAIRRIGVLLDGSFFAAQALPMAKMVAKTTGARLTLLSSVKDNTQELREQFEDTRAARKTYLHTVENQLVAEGFQVNHAVRPGFLADATDAFVKEQNIDLVITTTRGKSGAQHWLSGGVSSKLAQRLDIPILLIKSANGDTRAIPAVKRILVALDGSIFSEGVLPYARAFAEAFGSKLVLLTVPAVPDVQKYRAAADLIETMRTEAVTNITKFLEAVARSLREDGLDVHTRVTGSTPARTIVSAAEEEDADMIMITSRGRGGLELFLMGSVAQRVVQATENPTFLMPIHDRPD